MAVNARKVVFLFWSTLLIGTVAGTIIGLIQGIGGYFVVIVTAALWTVIAQMGFFAYLTIHRFGLGVFKSASLWNKVQLIIIVFAFFDLMFFRHYFFAGEGDTMLGYAIMPTLLLVYAVFVAYLKAKDTNRHAFIPALFFMYVVTMIEWIPAFTGDDLSFIINAVVPLLVANTWQLLVLHRLHEMPNGKQPTAEQWNKWEREGFEERKKEKENKKNRKKARKNA
ncbi:KinB-signaling pathway activation protein [Salisediminibacterium beveridgei]|uniref:KinB-signaling pathway activation protein n=1 Tax=Salisediminibacterium beveridgei TaxID=632773 RepID=UPI000847DB27|nr:KinB-signaling pathway activation protein [Salisediminibacterium beveridgei]